MYKKLEERKLEEIIDPQSAEDFLRSVKESIHYLPKPLVRDLLFYKRQNRILRQMESRGFKKGINSSVSLATEEGDTYESEVVLDENKDNRLFEEM